MNALRPTHGQNQRQVFPFQGAAVQVQFAVAGQLLTQVLDQCGQVFQAGVADMAGLQFEQVILLFDLQQVAVGLIAAEAAQGFAEQLFHPLGNCRGAVTAETADAQVRLPTAGGQGVEEVAQAVEQCVWAVIAGHQQLIPAVQGDLVDGQNQVLAHPGVAQCIGALGGHVHVHLAELPERVDANVDQQQYFAGHAGAE